MFCNPSIPLQTLRNREFRRTPRDSSTFDGSLLKYTMFRNPPNPPWSLRNCEFCRITRDSGNLDDSLLKYTIFRDHTIPLVDSTIATSAEFRVDPRKPMIVFNNVLCFVILPSLSRPSATANSAKLCGILVISMIVF